MIDQAVDQLKAGQAQRSPRETVPAQVLDERHETGLVLGVEARSGKLTMKDENGKTREFAAKRAKVTTVEGKTIAIATWSSETGSRCPATAGPRPRSSGFTRP